MDTRDYLTSEPGGPEEAELVMVGVAGDKPKAFLRPDFRQEARSMGKYTRRAHSVE